MRALNVTKGTVIADDVEIADTLWSRFKGLMLRSSLPAGGALVLERSRAIHTAFMRFPIDVVFVDGSGVVVKVSERLAPFRVAGSLRGARSVLELPPGASKHALVEPGDQLAFTE